MEYVTLPKTDLTVSRIGFGAEPIGGTDWGDVNVTEALAAVQRAYDLGITLYDTADVYGLGRSEELLSRGLGARRHEVVIVTKFGVNWRIGESGRARTFLDAAPERVVAALEASLRRLRLECIPLYLIHWPDPRTPLADTLAALQRSREAGKVRHFGVSNFSGALVREANQLWPLAAVECQYNLVDRSAERDVLPCCRELDIGMLSYGPLAQGLLTGKYGRDARFPTTDRRHRLPHFSAAALAGDIPALTRMKSLANCDGRSLPQLAVRWVLDTPGVSCAIVGAKTVRQVEENADVAGWRLAERDWAVLAGEPSTVTQQ